MASSANHNALPISLASAVNPISLAKIVPSDPLIEEATLLMPT